MDSSKNSLQKNPKDKMILTQFFKGKSILLLFFVIILLAIIIGFILTEYQRNYISFPSSKKENALKIQSITRTDVFVQNVGGSPVTISEVYVDGNLVTESVDYTINDNIDMLPGYTAIIKFTNDLPTPQVTIKVVTTDGTSDESTTTFS